MPRKVTPIEIAKIRKSLPYLRRYVQLPGWLLRQVEPPSLARLTAKDCRRIESGLAAGGVTVRVQDGRVLISPHRGPGRPPGPARRRGPKAVARSRRTGGPVDSRGRALSPKRRAAMKWQGRYMGALAGLTEAQKAQVKGVKLRRGYAAAIRTAKRFR